MKAIQFTCYNEQDTAALGTRMAEFIEEPLIIFLTGTLGSGKTRFAQAIATGLGIDAENVNSPTFTIMVPHQGRITLLHVDAYRINDLDEADQLGIDDWVDDGCVLVVEWAERIQQILPPPDIRIQIEPEDETIRRFSFSAHSDPGEKICEKLLSTPHD